MVKIDYLYDIFENQLPLLFTLLQGDAKEVFYICVGDQLVGTINKVTNGWEQIGGSKMSEEFINKIGKVIEHECLIPDMSIADTNYLQQISNPQA